MTSMNHGNAVQMLVDFEPCAILAFEQTAATMRTPDPRLDDAANARRHATGDRALAQQIDLLQRARGENVVGAQCPAWCDRGAAGWESVQHNSPSGIVYHRLKVAHLTPDFLRGRAREDAVDDVALWWVVTYVPPLLTGRDATVDAAFYLVVNHDRGVDGDARRIDPMMVDALAELLHEGSRAFVGEFWRDENGRTLAQLKREAADQYIEAVKPDAAPTPPAELGGMHAPFCDGKHDPVRSYGQWDVDCTKPLQFGLYLAGGATFEDDATEPERHEPYIGGWADLDDQLAAPVTTIARTVEIAAAVLAAGAALAQCQGDDQAAWLDGAARTLPVRVRS